MTDRRQKQLEKQIQNLRGRLGNTGKAIVGINPGSLDLYSQAPAGSSTGYGGDLRGTNRLNSSLQSSLQGGNGGSDLFSASNVITRSDIRTSDFTTNKTMTNNNNNDFLASSESEQSELNKPKRPPTLAQTAAAFQTGVLADHVNKLTSMHARVRAGTRTAVAKARMANGIGGTGTRRGGNNAGNSGENNVHNNGVGENDIQGSSNTSSRVRTLSDLTINGRDDENSSFGHVFNSTHHGASGGNSASENNSISETLVTRTTGNPRQPSSGPSSVPGYKIAKFYRHNYTEKLKNYKKSLNLAERLEIMPKPIQPVTSDAAWNTFCEPVKEKLLRDIDCRCSICLQRFSPSEAREQRQCVILYPCAHLFHQGCLQSYERFCEGRPPCPMCRKEYSDCALFPAGGSAMAVSEGGSKSTSEDGTSEESQEGKEGGNGGKEIKLSAKKKAFLDLTARLNFFKQVGTIRLQRIWRGFYIRKYVSWKMMTFKKTPMLFQKTRLAILRKRREALESSETEIDKFFSEVDVSVGRAKDIMNTAWGNGETPGSGTGSGGMGGKNGQKVSQEKWDWARSECLKRGFPECECPICFVEFTVGATGPAVSSVTGVGCVALLDCGHCFHAVCIESFERFQNAKTEFKCPVCRQGPYERRLWKVARKKKKKEAEGVEVGGEGE